MMMRQSVLGRTTLKMNVSRNSINRTLVIPLQRRYIERRLILEQNKRMTEVEQLSKTACLRGNRCRTGYFTHMIRSLRTRA